MDNLLSQLKSIVGDRGWLSDPEALTPHLTEWRERWLGRTPLMVMPRTTQQVADIVRACRAANTPIVIQGGNTGLCGGAIPAGDGNEILLSMSRMNRVREVSAEDFSMVAEAGCILAELQDEARRVERLFPLSLSAEGSCQIGGNIATNAGGINVLKFGTTRDQVLGLEVVLPDGRIWNGLRSLRKDTAGYDLKQIFIGSEGTLGVITAASLKLYPSVTYLKTAMVALPTPESAIELLGRIRGAMRDQVYAFELISDRAMRFVTRRIPGCRDPFDAPHKWYVLLEVAGERETLEGFLMECYEAGLFESAVMAGSIAQGDELWRIRHSISEAQKFEGASLKHDISVPIGKIPQFLDQASSRIMHLVPEARIVAFGHVGDGNLHFNISQPGNVEAAAFLDRSDDLSEIVYATVSEFNGSISAEHGIGQAKKELLRKYRSDVELDMMRTIKAAFDPDNLFNPGKVL
jgi:FAD/FMN-containing dehydrogenase